MKSVARWIFDPYVHVFLIATVVAYLATAGLGGGESTASWKQLECAMCESLEGGASTCQHIVSRVPATLR